jgi:hypothetical protein
VSREVTDMPGEASNMQQQRVLVWVMGAILAGVAAPAWAQTASPDQPAKNAADDFEGADQMMESGELGEDGKGKPAAERPWAEGVSPENQEQARALFKEGNDLLRESLFPQAVKKYRAALELWDHPGIHFTLSLALLNLDQPIAVYRSLEKAMKHGPGPLGAEKYERAQSYFDLVSDQLGTVEITINEPQAKVTLDGKPVLTGPGTYRELLPVGEHQIVASKPEYIDKTVDFVIEPKELERLDVVMFSIDEMTVSKRRWPVWMPWAVVGAGAAVLAVGGGMHTQSSSSFASFDKSFDARCMNGCDDSEVPDLNDDLAAAERQQNIAVTAYVIGGAALVGGLVLVFVNQPQVFRRDVEAGTERELTIAPMIAPDTAGVSAALRF